MGTREEIARLQDEIRDGIARSGVSLNAFAKWRFEEKEDKTSCENFVRNFKHQLTRPSSSSFMLAILERHRDSLLRHQEYHQKGMIPPRNIRYAEIKDELRPGMSSISKRIDDAMEKKVLAEEAAADNGWNSPFEASS